MMLGQEAFIILDNIRKSNEVFKKGVTKDLIRLSSLKSSFSLGDSFI
jgi:hypothetical protein